MNHTRRVFVCLLGLVVILSILVFPVSAQGNDSGAAKSEEDYLLQSQRNLDRSFSVLNTVATLIGVLVAILAISIGFVKSVNFLEIMKLRGKNGRHQETKVIEIKNKAEIELDELRKGIPQTILTEKPSQELLDKLDDISHRLEKLELRGVLLKPEDYLNRGNDFYFKGDYESALTAYGKVIELESDNAIALDNKGAVLGRLGRYNEAIEIYDNAIELQPDFAISWFDRARIYSLMGNKQNAISDLEKAIELYAILKDSAKIDEGFKILWDDEDFKNLVE